MTPYRSAAEGYPEALYNQKHSKVRHIVEICIGVLKSRFRCFSGTRQLHYKPSKVIQIAALHNLCIINRTENKNSSMNVEINQESLETETVFENVFRSRRNTESN